MKEKGETAGKKFAGSKLGLRVLSFAAAVVYNEDEAVKVLFSFLRDEKKHVLSLVGAGVTSTELTKIWHKSKGAISQTVKKLIGAGYVEKQYKDGNKKTAFLYVTEKGKKLSGIHKAYDVADITRTTAHLVKTCSEEDLAAFYRVIRQYIKLLKYEP